MLFCLTHWNGVCGLGTNGDIETFKGIFLLIVLISFTIPSMSSSVS